MDLIDRWMSFACLVAGTDPTVVRGANAVDRMTVGGNAVVLLLVGTLAVVVWSALFSSFLPLPVALALGLLVGAMVFMFDRAMSASDWSLTGVLRSGRAGPEFWAKVGGRAAVAMVLAVATAYGAVLVLCGGAIEDRLRQERQQRNEPIVQEALQLKHEARERLLSPLQGEQRLIEAERGRLQEVMKERETLVAQARERAARARVEAEREREGGLRGYVQGEGPRFRDARRLEREAQDAAALAATDAANMQRRFDELSVQAAAKTRELHQAMQLAAQEEQRIDAQMSRDPQWTPERGDPLSRAIALEQLRVDAHFGPAVKRLERIAMLTLMTLELMFLMIKVFFSPASLIALRLTLRTRQEAAQEVHRYNEVLRRLRRSSATETIDLGTNVRHPPIRLVSADEDGQASRQQR